MRSAKERAWRKILTRGGVDAGGAGEPHKLLPFERLPTPSATEQPILVENRPHRDYFFPVTGDEMMARLRQLPADHIAGITHVWMRRIGPSDRDRPFGCYAYKRGYRVIVLYPWPRRSYWMLGRGKPAPIWHQMVRRFDVRLERVRGNWVARFTEDGARRFFLDDLLLHEVGHHNDRWFTETRKKEQFAIQYAASWSRRLAAIEQPGGTGPRLSKERRRKLHRLIRAVYPYWTAAIDTDHLPRPRSDLTVSFQLVDRRGRPRSKRVWLRADAIDGLTAQGLEQRIRRAEQRAE